jgi:hypothetical protein
MLAGRTVVEYYRPSVSGAPSTRGRFDQGNHAAHPSFGLLPGLVGGNDEVIE